MPISITTLYYLAEYHFAECRLYFRYVVLLSVIMLCCAEYRYTLCCYAECHYA
jgi:hypothetical protein